MDDVLLVACNQVALEPAVGAVTEDIECGPAQGAHFRKQAKYRHHPGAERALARPSEGVGAAAKQRGRKVEFELEVAFELVAKLLFEIAIGIEPRDLVLFL